MPCASAIRSDQRDEKQTAHSEADPGNLCGVEERDHQHRADVIGDGQRGEEDFERSRYSIAEESKHAEGKGNIGSHRNAPAGCTWPALVEHDVEPSWNDHPTERCCDRQRGLSKGSKLTDQCLQLDLQPDEQEE